MSTGVTFASPPAKLRSAQKPPRSYDVFSQTKSDLISSGFSRCICPSTQQSRGCPSIRCPHNVTFQGRPPRSYDAQETAGFRQFSAKAVVTFVVAGEHLSSKQIICAPPKSYGEPPSRCYFPPLSVVNPPLSVEQTPIHLIYRPAFLKEERIMNLNK
jgi:hypothetical protein